MRLAFFWVIFLLLCRVRGEGFWFTTSCESRISPRNPTCLPAWASPESFSPFSGTEQNKFHRLLLLHLWWQLCLLSVKSHQAHFISILRPAGLHSVGGDILKKREPRWIWISLGKQSSPLVLPLSQPIVPTLLGIFSNELCLYLSPSPSSPLAWEMPTNQSSPWNVGNPRRCSNAEKIATTSKTPKVPCREGSIELVRSKEQARSLACHVASSVSPSGLMTVTRPMLSVWEKGEKKTTEGHFTTVPHVSSNMPEQLNGIQILKPILATGLSETNMVTRSSAPSSIQKKECQVGLLAS